jgi:hypothetical protein
MTVLCEGMDEFLGSEADVDGNVFDLLANERRRHVLSCLRAVDGSLSMAELAETVAAAESDRPASAVTSEQVDRVQLTLYHVHVPKLAAAGVACYDENQDAVSLPNASDRLERCLALLDRV